MLTFHNIEQCKLLFGKVDDQYFHLDFKAPFTPMQAMAAAIASFDYAGP